MNMASAIARCLQRMSTCYRMVASTPKRTLLSGKNKPHLTAFMGDNILKRCMSLSSTLARNVHSKTSYATQSAAKLVSHIHEPSLVLDARCNSETKMVEVSWDDGSQSVFPYIFLRDNCTCDVCYKPKTRSRMILMRDLNVDIVPQHVEVNENAALEVIWDDGHVSKFPSDWLLFRRFGAEGAKERQKLLPLEPILWNKETIENNLPQFHYHELVNSNEMIFRWLCSMETYGVALITGTPQEKGMLRNVADQISFLRTTNYGPEFHVETKLDPTDLAYTPLTLGLHTDGPWLHYSPGVQMLHCIKQVPTEGGGNQFVDGFLVGEIIRQERPDYFEILCSTDLSFHDHGGEFSIEPPFYNNSDPTFRLNRMGEVRTVRYSQQHRNSVMHNIPAAMVKPVYEALKYMETVMMRPENQLVYKMNDGDITCFHNLRVLHGRDGYKVLEGGERKLEGAYMDWDDLYSRRRYLQNKLNLQHPQ